MIRKAAENEIKYLVDIWLDNICKYHDKMPILYWEQKVNIMENYFLNEQTFVYEDKGIIGYVNVIDESTISSIFIIEEYQRNNIGTLLLEVLKENHNVLHVSILEDKDDVLNFFYKNGFEFLYNQEDALTNTKEKFLIWRKNEN